MFAFKFLDLKIVVLGGGGVGKTSFIHRYTCNEFSDTISVRTKKAGWSAEFISILRHWQLLTP